MHSAAKPEMLWSARTRVESGRAMVSRDEGAGRKSAHSWTAIAGSEAISGLSLPVHLPP